jgi:20S proteasome subunit beta 6
MASGGCRTDVVSLQKLLDLRLREYIDNHDKEMSTPSVAQLLSTNLYYRRFFPFYAFNVVGGVDKEGKGAVYTYDAIGSFERVKYASQGAGQKLIIPILDNVVGNKNRADAPHEYTREEAVELVKDVFITAGERDIFTGDRVEIYTIDANGVRKEIFDLKAD